MERAYPRNLTAEPIAATSDAVDPLDELLRRCALREERALNELYQLVAPRLLGLLVRMLKRRALAEEALQEVMVRIWERADQYAAHRGRAVGWITAIARYRAIDLLREQRVTHSLDDAPADAPIDASASDFADATTSDRSRHALNDCFGLLTDEQRRCLSLAYVDGFSQDDIARAVSSPLGTVKSWIRRGLASLKQCMDS
jgi:RNA polymerase sigma-70 factor, ECF subfamily